MWYLALETPFKHQISVHLLCGECLRGEIDAQDDIKIAML